MGEVDIDFQAPHSVWSHPWSSWIHALLARRADANIQNRDGQQSLLCLVAGCCHHWNSSAPWSVYGMSDFDSTVLFWTIQNDVLAGLTDVSKSAVNG
jgi:hypothetical protein